VTSAPSNQEKVRLFRELLQDGIVSVHLAPLGEGVQVPARFAKQDWLVLNFSYNYHLRDFHFDDVRVEASLSFAGQAHHCVVPWSAVFAVTDGNRDRGHVWHEDVPPSVLAAQEAALREPTRPPGGRGLTSVPSEPKRSVSGLRAVPSATVRAEPARSKLAAAPRAEPPRKRAEPNSADTKPTRRPGLQVLKGGAQATAEATPTAAPQAPQTPQAHEPRPEEGPSDPSGGGSPRPGGHLRRVK